MAIEYRVYVKINTNVDVSQLKYQLKILNTSTQKIINRSGFSIDYKTKYSFIKSGSNYRTGFVKLIYKSEPTETLKDLVIIFDLFRIDKKGKEYHVIRNYKVNNMVGGV